MSDIRVLLADDHPVFLKGLKMLIELQDDSVQIVASMPDGKSALQALESTPVDVALLDIVMPGMGGVETAIKIKKGFPATKIIMLTTFDERDLVLDALKAGAEGYLLKDAPVEKIIHAVKAVHNGDVLMSPQVARVLGGSANPNQHTQGPTAQQKLNALSPREQEVLVVLAQGRDNLEIAEELGISERTVRNYVSKIYDVVGVHNRTQVVLWAQDHGIG